MEKFITTLAAIVLLSGCAVNRFPSRAVAPPYVKAGDTIGIVSISSRSAPDSDTAHVRQIFSQWGLNVKFGQHLLDQRDASFGASDVDRAADLQAMLDDPAIAAIVMFRGGYGAVRTLDYLDLSRLRRNPKWVAGYSDVTMLHAALSRRGVQSIHGTMPISFAKEGIDSSMLSLRDALTGTLKRIEVAPNPLNQKGEATGVLTGGNLSLVYAAAGTDMDNSLTQGDWILLIEDVSEKMYSIDRMLQNLYRSGKLARVKAVLVGHFTDISNVERFGGMSVDELIASYTRRYRIPVVFGFPSGHETPNLSLYLGRKVKVKVTDAGATVEL